MNSRDATRSDSFQVGNAAPIYRVSPPVYRRRVFPRRQLHTIEQRSLERAERVIRPPRPRQAFLVTPFTDRVTEVLIQYTDPRLGSRGMAVKARVRPGATNVIPNLPAGSPVTVTAHHGQLEIVGYHGQTEVG